MNNAILLMSGRGFVSWAIRWFTRSKYSHAALLLDDGAHIIEAWQGKGVRLETITNWNNIDIFDVPEATKEQWDSVVGFATSQIGRPYDYGAVLKFVSRRRDKENARWFCSELVHAAFLHAGINLLGRIEPWTVSPGILALSPSLVQRNIHHGNDRSP